VGALGRNDRGGALDILDTLIRQSEYLPLALSFLGTQFRLALGGAGGRIAQPAADPGALRQTGRAHVGLAGRAGVSDGFQLLKEASVGGAELIFQADKSLRDTRPDDRW